MVGIRCSEAEATPANSLCYLEDQLFTQFISHEVWPFGKGNKPILRGCKNHGFLITYRDDPPSSNPCCGRKLWKHFFCRSKECWNIQNLLRFFELQTSDYQHLVLRVGFLEPNTLPYLSLQYAVCRVSCSTGCFFGSDSHKVKTSECFFQQTFTRWKYPESNEMFFLSTCIYFNRACSGYVRFRNHLASSMRSLRFIFG